MTEGEYLAKIEEAFIAGLAPKTAIEIVKLSLNSSEQILERTSRIEEEIVAEINKEEKTERNRQHGHENRDQRMWCSIHRTNTHSTENCRSRRNTRSSQNSNPNNFITEPATETNLITLEGSIVSHRVTCLLDTGAEGNYIGNRVVQLAKLQPKKIIPVYAELANNSKTLIK